MEVENTGKVACMKLLEKVSSEDAAKVAVFFGAVYGFVKLLEFGGSLLERGGEK